MKNIKFIVSLLLVITMLIPFSIGFSWAESSYGNMQISKFLKTIGTNNYEIHYIGIYEANSSKSANNTVKVEVTIKDKPVLLVLSGHDPIHWKIDKVGNSKIVGVVLGGYHKQTCTGLNGIPMLSLSYDEIDESYYMGYCKDRDKYLDTIETVYRLFGKKPLTLQAKYDGEYFKVDGKNSILYEEIKEPKSTGKVKFVVQYDFDANISSDGLTMSYSRMGASSFSKVNIGHIKGKYYFEMKLNMKYSSKIDTWTSAGIGTESTIDAFCPDDGDYGYVYKAIDTWRGPLKPNNLKNGDIIGFAMDLDKSKLYMSLNGKWINGAPDSNKGMAIKAGRQYFAVASSGSVTDSWTGMFKQSALKYTLPKGYMPYEY